MSVKGIGLVKKAIRAGTVFYIEPVVGKSRRLVTYNPLEGKFCVDGAIKNNTTIESYLREHALNHPEDWEMDIEFLEEKYVV